MYQWIASYVTGVLQVAQPKDDWKRPRKKRRDVYRPRVERLENRTLLSCGPTGTDLNQPWCRDITAGAVPGYSGDGHAEVNIANRLEEARALAIQDVETETGVEQRTLLAGFAKRDLMSTLPTAAVARLCENGHVDDGTDVANGGCGGPGFGDNGTGIMMIDFFPLPTETDDKGEFNTVLVYDVTATTGVCGGVTQRILVAGMISVPFTDQVPEQDVWGVARVCPDGSALDVSFGGNDQDYDQQDAGEINTVDAPGTVTIVFADNTDTVNADWTRESAPYDMVVQPTEEALQPKVVIAGYAAFPPVPAPKIEYFALARLDTDADCIERDLNPGCFDNMFGPGNGPTEYDPGRIRFDAMKSPTTGTYVDGDYDFSRIHGVELIDNGNNTFDILIAGTTFYKNPVDPPTIQQRDFFVARVKHNGDRTNTSASTAWEPIVWREFIAFEGGSGEPRDDIAFDIVFNGLDKVFVAGVSCANSLPCVDSENSPNSNIAFARVDVDDMGTVDFEYQVTAEGDGPYSNTYTDVAYSVVLQPVGEDRLVVLGGYSVDDTSGRPYMSGARFPFDGPADADDYEFFRSDFPNPGVSERGDQAWELGIQSNNRIVAGGVRTRGIGTTATQTFGAMRLCPNPNDESPCEGSLAPIGGGEGGNPGQFAPPDATSFASTSRQQSGQSVCSTPKASAFQENATSPLPEVLESLGRELPVTPPAVLVERATRDDFFTQLGLNLDFAASQS